jgi:hypothetical protein
VRLYLEKKEPSQKRAEGCLSGRSTCIRPEFKYHYNQKKIEKSKRKKKSKMGWGYEARLVNHPNSK